MDTRWNHETATHCARHHVAIATPIRCRRVFRAALAATSRRGIGCLAMIAIATCCANGFGSPQRAQDSAHQAAQTLPTNPLRGSSAVASLPAAVRQTSAQDPMAGSAPPTTVARDLQEPAILPPVMADRVDEQAPQWEELEGAPRSILGGTGSPAANHNTRVLADGPESIGEMLPAPSTPRTVTLNPLAIPQGVASLAFEDHQPLNGQRLGFPFSIVPDGFYHRIPRLRLAWDNPSRRSIGRGEPLQTTSWRNRPLHVDFFSGGYFAASPIDGVGDPAGANFIGGRVGWDLNHYFGTELRIGYARANLDDIQNSMDIRVSDVHLHYYPWGDARVRPYTSIGLGLTHMELVDVNGLGRSATSANLPIGIGVKYFVKHWLTLRAEFEDNITFGSGTFATTNNLSITGGLEFRFGGRRPTYFPFTSSRMSMF